MISKQTIAKPSYHIRKTNKGTNSIILDGNSSILCFPFRLFFSTDTEQPAIMNHIDALSFRILSFSYLRAFCIGDSNSGHAIIPSFHGNVNVALGPKLYCFSIAE